ncbi:class I SAM-dependent methyltransferase [Paenibacillus gyeongsangnamensis]|uniref:class I SAM-dependent methyltransferase n=1 Tax=Paenibacillus gyeongsangnamensis TaxID=3388067 RepID=UPI002FD650AE
MGKWFAKIYDLMMQPLEQKGLTEIRKTLIRNAGGKVLEIGSGTGLNFPFYERADKVIAIEPQLLMMNRSLIRANGALVPIDVILADAEEIPF